MVKTVIVTETGGDLLGADIEKYGIKVVPMHVTMDGVSLDDGSFPPADIFDSYQRTKQLPKTSATNPREYRQTFDEILQQAPDAHILHLAYSAVTTASYHNALLASEGLDCVTHSDTKNVSGGLRAIVLRMAEFIKNNPKATPWQLKAEAENLAERCRFAFFPGDMEYLKAGGRVSNAAYLVASILGLKPLIEILDGKLVGTKKYRGSDSKIYKKMINDYLTEHKLEKEGFFFVCSAGLDGMLAKELEKEALKYGYKNITWVVTGGVISTHSGPGAFGIGGFEVT